MPVGRGRLRALHRGVALRMRWSPARTGGCIWHLPATISALVSHGCDANEARHVTKSTVATRLLGALLLLASVGLVSWQALLHVL